jgi:hypothetical protein
MTDRRTTWLATVGASAVLLALSVAIVTMAGGIELGSRTGAVAAATAIASHAVRSVAVPTAMPTPESPAPSPSASAKPSPSPSAAPSGPFAMDLYRAGEMASERYKIWCVPAAMQTIVNIIDRSHDTTLAMQRRLYALARRLSPATLVGTGAEPEGWAAGLNQLGYGRYEVAIARTRAAAIRLAAAAIRATGRPAGLLVWRGAHSWVMSGFRATADPAKTNAFSVTHVYIEDVWYPLVSSIWGASRPPDALVPVGKLAEDYFPWRRPTRHYPDKDGMFVLVIPVKG